MWIRIWKRRLFWPLFLRKIECGDGRTYRANDKWLANLNQKRPLTAQLDGQECIIHHQYLIQQRLKKTRYTYVWACVSVCVCVGVRVCAFLTSTPKSSHSLTYINTYTEQSFRNCHLFLTLFCMCYRKCSFQLFKISHSSKPPCLLPFGCRHST